MSLYDAGGLLLDQKQRLLLLASILHHDTTEGESVQLWSFTA